MILVTSDVHLRPDRPERTARFLQFLASLGHREPAPDLYILGDLFDFWIGPRHPRNGLVRTVFDGFREATGRGARIHFLPGNRDFHLGEGVLSGIGVRRLGETHSLESSAGRLLLAHGDQFCTRDWPYRITRAIIRSLPARLLWRALPVRLAVDLATGFGAMSRRSVRRKSDPILAISVREMERAFRDGTDAVVCGHVHRQGHTPMTGNGWKGDLYTLGAWDEGQPHLVVVDGSISFRQEASHGP
jgi:UDP-2,3-diacylglucosamine hydrolase